MKKYMIIPWLFFFIYLILRPEQAVSSAESGLQLWYTSIVPVLFPFMLICRIIVQSDYINNIPNCITKPLQKMFRCSHEGSVAIITGFLCGFPMGARFVTDLNQINKINKEEASYLISFVNNLSPGFLISYLAAGQLKKKSLSIPVISIVFGASLLYGLILSRTYTAHSDISISENTPEKNECIFASLDDSIYLSVINTLRLGGYIVFFSILSDAISMIPVKHPLLLAAASSIEVTRGIRMICSTEYSFPAQMLLTLSLSSFGGWSAAFQTAGVCRMNPAQFLQYIKSRGIITLLSIILFIIWYSFKIILLNDLLPG